MNRIKPIKFTDTDPYFIPHSITKFDIIVRGAIDHVDVAEARSMSSILSIPYFTYSPPAYISNKTWIMV